ncbi:MAG: M23 family metallopeptidase [Verrucomicrobia bacterium]|nr:M23 family metallopeptidase [Verrucomicrobiota bacterium]
MSRKSDLLALMCLALGLVSPILGETFTFPTANKFLLTPEREADFFTATSGKPWSSGTYGCVRSEGWQLHEGLDIKCLERDDRGEPIDPVMASAEGFVEYANRNPALSNYGNYVILKHRIDGLEVFSLYAHLSLVCEDLAKGDLIRKGDVIGIMGRTSNTQESISLARAHVHFEVALQLNERFPEWHEKNFPDQRNDHDRWNGQNFIGVDPSVLLRASPQAGMEFSLRRYLRGQTELCRVLVLETDFPWLRQYTRLIRRNPVSDAEGVAGYELALNFAGLPFELIPRAPSEIDFGERVQLLTVNKAEKDANPCGRILNQEEGKWRLTNKGMRLIDLLTY